MTAADALLEVAKKCLAHARYGERLSPETVEALVEAVASAEIKIAHNMPHCTHRFARHSDGSRLCVRCGQEAAAEEITR